MLITMTKQIELVEIVDNGDGTQSLIAECNGYENGVCLEITCQDVGCYASDFAFVRAIFYLACLTLQVH